MYLTTNQFTQALLQTQENQNEILSALEFLYKLRKKLGKKMETKAYMDIIHKEYPIAYNVRKACIAYNKKKTVQIKQILRTGKQSSDSYTQQFTINTGSEDIQSLIKKMHTTFDNAAVITTQNEDPMLYIQGEGFYYRRSVDKDINKLLS